MLDPDDKRVALEQSRKIAFKRIGDLGSVPAASGAESLYSESHHKLSLMGFGVRLKRKYRNI